VAEALEARGERVEREKQLLGLTSVVAGHLLRGAPRLHVRKLVLEGVKSFDLGGELLDIRASNLSSEPWLVDQPLELSLAARSGRFAFSFKADPKTSRSGETSFVWKDIPIDSIAERIKFSGQPPLKGGMLDLKLGGKLDFAGAGGVKLDLPLVAALRDTTLALPGMTETKVEALALPIGLRGPLASPRVSLDDQALADALVAAGKSELAKQVRDQAGKLLGEQGGAAGKAAGELLEGKAKPEEVLKEAEKKATEEGKKALDDLLKKKLPGFGDKKQP
jgi:hypothetical protein